MEIAIIGGGNIGTQFAVHCASKGHNVTVFTSRPQQWSTHIKLVDRSNAPFLEGDVSVTDDIKSALNSVDLIFITTPSFMADEISAKVAAALPNRSKKTYIGLIPGTGGMECAFYKYNKNCIIFGLQRVPSVVRLIEYGRSACAVGYRNKLHVAALDGRFSAECAELIEDIFDIQTATVPSYLSLTLTPSNPILHTSRLYNIFGSYVSGEKFERNPLFYEEWNDESSSLLIKMDDEVQRICKALPEFDLSDVKSLKVHYESDTPSSLTKKIGSIEGFKGIYSPMIKSDDGFVPDYNSRFFTADFPYGLWILIQIAGFAGVSVPNMQAVYDWYEGFSGSNAKKFSYGDYQITNRVQFIDFYLQNHLQDKN